MNRFKMNRRWWIGFLLLSLLLGSVSLAWAKPPTPRVRRAIRRPALRGDVTAVDGTTLSVNAQRGGVTVLTGDRTRFRIPGTDAATLADVQVGDQLAVWGKREGVLRARMILVIPAGATLLRGEVAAIEVDSFRLQTRGGEQVVQVDAETRFRLPGVEDPGLADLSAGARVWVGGIKNRDENVLARMVGVLPEQPRRGRRVGQVAAIEGDTLTLTLRSGDALTLHTDAETRFLLPGVEDPGLDDLRLGQWIGAAGRWREDGSLWARTIGARPARLKPSAAESSHP